MFKGNTIISLERRNIEYMELEQYQLGNTDILHKSFVG